MILCGYSNSIRKIYHSKVLKNKVPCHAVADKPLVEWSPRELWQLETESLDD